LVLSTLPAIGFIIGGGFYCFEIDKGAADITVNDMTEQVPEGRHDADRCVPFLLIVL